MIPRANVTAWRSEVPWTSDALVEQDLVLTRALVELFLSRQLREQVAFRGGTVLHKIFFNPAGRFSEDIDLVQISPGAIGPIMSAIRERLDGWLGSPSTKRGQGRVVLLYRFVSEMEPVGRRRLKVEINTREHFSILGFDARSLEVSNPWFEGRALITTYRLDELLGTKMRALFQRKKGRDLFDLGLGLVLPDANPYLIVKCFLRYIEHDGMRVSRARFEANLAAKEHDSAFREDVMPLLAPDISWDFDSTLAMVSKELVAAIPGEPWKGARTDPG